MSLCPCLCVSVCSLQYKYMKLVSSASGSDQLPAAETCALDDGEEDDDDDGGRGFDGGGRGFGGVKVRKGTQFFHKLKMSSRISRDGGKVTFH